ncbi:MAG: hypothetical protein CR981_01940 [Proteobacteria bacterium]|nr:MAG: hypothetical protein CR981_01940 [Pseudomonadota bacterium]PIE65439.1 MAG: hypothetical protein CSA26_03715 [Desulfobacterales bacterium]
MIVSSQESLFISPGRPFSRGTTDNISAIHLTVFSWYTDRVIPFSTQAVPAMKLITQHTSDNHQP